MTTLDFGNIAISLIGGLAIFLYGMKVMTESLTLVAGRRMKQVLASLTRNRVTAAIAGALVTAVIQSSSVTTVLVVSFITAGLMSFSQSIGMILGANVGTTITAQIIAFKVTHAAMFMIAFGFFTELLASNHRIKHLATMTLGLGLLFLGMNLMSQATEPLRNYQPFIDLMRDIQNPLAGIAVGAAFTALVQSSSATTGIIIILASQGFINLETGIALVMGANIGTCVTAILSAIGKPREAVQAATVHVVFNVLGVLLWVGFIPEFAAFITQFSPVSTHLEGTARMAADAPRQIANAHTLFNIVNLLLFIGFTGVLARIVSWLIPVKTTTEIPAATPRYIDDYYLDEPSMALDRTRLELKRLGDYTLDMVRDSLPALTMGTYERIRSLQQRDDEADALHDAIVRFLGKLSTQNLIEPQPQQLYRFIGAANYLENIGDVVETSITEASKQRLQKDLHISPETLNRLKVLHDELIETGELTLQALIDDDLEKAEAVNNSKATFNQMMEQTRQHLSQRVTIDTPRHMATYRLENNVIESFKHIHSLYRRIAKLILAEQEEKVEEEASPAQEQA
jgi:phosphate:Na+ symporter